MKNSLYEGSLDRAFRPPPIAGTRCFGILALAERKCGSYIACESFVGHKKLLTIHRMPCDARRVNVRTEAVFF